MLCKSEQLFTLSSPGGQKITHPILEARDVEKNVLFHVTLIPYVAVVIAEKLSP